MQLVIRKELNPIKLLVLRAKRLIDFFLRPKQSERLENIQKRSQNEVDEIRNIIYNLFAKHLHLDLEVFYILKVEICDKIDVWY